MTKCVEGFVEVEGYSIEAMWKQLEATLPEGMSGRERWNLYTAFYSGAVSMRAIFDRMFEAGLNSDEGGKVLVALHAEFEVHKARSLEMAQTLSADEVRH